MEVFQPWWIVVTMDVSLSGRPSRQRLDDLGCGNMWKLKPRNHEICEMAHPTTRIRGLPSGHLLQFAMERSTLF